MKSKFATVVASASLVASLGLGACAGQPAANNSGSSSSSSAEATSAEASSTEASSSSSAVQGSSAATTSDADPIISWQGALEDGTLVDFIESSDGTEAGLTITPAGTKEEKKYLGTVETAADGKKTLTDTETKETISFTVSDVDKDGVRLIEVDGFGKGAMVGMTAQDWKMVADIEELTKSLEATVDWQGALEDGTLIYYAASEDGAHGAISLTPLTTGESKLYLGGLTTADGKTTISDETTKETVTFTIGEPDEYGLCAIEIDNYGKGTVVQMSVGDYIAAELS